MMWYEMVEDFVTIMGPSSERLYESVLKHIMVRSSCTCPEGDSQPWANPFIDSDLLKVSAQSSEACPLRRSRGVTLHLDGTMTTK